MNNYNNFCNESYIDINQNLKKCSLLKDVDINYVTSENNMNRYGNESEKISKKISENDTRLIDYNCYLI